MFSHLDLSNAYSQIKLDKEAKKLLVINTNLDLFQYNRLPFGVSSTPAIFQQTMSQVTAGIIGVAAYLTDILISASTRSEHIKRLREVFKRLQLSGFRLQEKKCSFVFSSVHYLGFILDCDGIKPDPDKIQAIKNMRSSCRSTAPYIHFERGPFSWQAATGARSLSSQFKQPRRHVDRVNLG